ncbi:MAG TPA: biopolymer transporter ExbD [Pirellulales bacterium]|nr:biopolymer transporter ExbD [Pirellulales bacterium]
MPLKTHADEDPVLNVTSMIDVILVLTIFFMVATKFREDERKLDLKVPVVSNTGALSTAPEPKVVNVYQDGHVSLGTQPVSLDELTRLLAAAHAQYKKLSVLIRGDKLATHGRMTEVYNACQKAGIAELAISVKLDTVKR